ncbi:15-hydroxyprostaglandin dehydrogenase [NAD(+)]-like [Maniola jurtina]|uniref:15-hydroxyprostaglandin dehydrogenase [NAD(+)]-like n=1 Tax=Maniola jurtina TaxID=191418 RepID=UPI001E68A708|nr:15-hydroxyprostaglandin dehydrogenase [NAD(+)]-like [Maniola jurtina]
MNSLINKVVIVTGGANGIGAQIVQELIKEQTKYVAIVDLDDASGVTLQNKLKEEYGRDVAGFYKCDVTNDAILHGIFDKIVEDFGTVDVVINNAGIATEKIDTYKKLIDINFTATVSSTLKALELMRADNGGAGGTIINISSIAALTLMSPGVFIYSATKSAVLHLSTCMGKEDYYRHTKVRVMTTCFGATDTEIIDKMISFDELVTENMLNIIEGFKKENMIQSSNAAAQGVVEAYKTGKTGSTWLIDGGKIMDISDRICDAFKIMSTGIKIEAKTT